MTLHEAMRKALRDAGHSLTPSELAQIVNSSGSYRKRDGSPVAASQVGLRARNYSHLFENESGRITLVDGAFTHVAGRRQTSTSEVQAQPVATAVFTDSNSPEPAELRRLLDPSSFISAADADTSVPSAPGLYAIRLADQADLPNEFGELAAARGHRLIYIGKATTSLETRLVGQELRARGHGTFFRSIGAVLGFRPAPGSLVGKRNGRNYRFVPADEAAIIAWINDNLLVNWIELDPESQHGGEAGLIREFRPLFNLAGNPEASARLSALRAECVRIANDTP